MSAANGTGDLRLIAGRKFSTEEYVELLGRVRAAVNANLPDDATVLVASKGDTDLLELGSRRAWHFPQTDTGEWVGFHPPTSADAIAHIEFLRARGGEYFLMPATAFWWLNHYGDFTLYLQHAYRLVVRQDDTCLIFALREKGLGSTNGSHGDRNALARHCAELAWSLLPDGAVVAVVSDGDDDLLDLDGQHAMHFPCSSDGTHLDRPVPDAGTARAQLAVVQERGAEFFVVPAPACLSSRRYCGLLAVLRAEHRLVTQQKHVCEIWELASDPDAAIHNGRSS